MLEGLFQPMHLLVIFGIALLHSRPNWAFDNISILKTLGIARL